MKRNKKNNEKNDKPGTSSRAQLKEKHDLAYYVHDRVSLMREVFTVLKAKEIKQITPGCIENLSIDEIEELCLEELLGISSKRVCAILDGAEPPSDTDSSSSDPDKSSDSPSDVISLSSSNASEDGRRNRKSKSKSKKDKHKKKKRRESEKEKSDREQSGTTQTNVTSDDPTRLSRAARAGITVLELLELEARARAIKAQLGKAPQDEAPSSPEVLIKEEVPQVFIISDDDDDDQKPKVDELEIEAQRGAREKEDEIQKEIQKQSQLEKEKQIEQDKNTALEKRKAKLERKSKRREEKARKKIEKEKKEKDAKKLEIEKDRQRLQQIESEIERLQKQDDDDVILIEEDPPPDTKAVEKETNPKDMTITIQGSDSRKVKLDNDRLNVVISVPNTKNATSVASEEKRKVVCVEKKLSSTVKKVEKLKSVINKADRKRDEISSKEKERDRYKDQDEIALHMSDSEKQDLLDDLDRYEKNISSSSDSESNDTDLQNTEEKIEDGNTLEEKIDAGNTDGNVEESTEKEIEVDKIDKNTDTDKMIEVASISDIPLVDDGIEKQNTDTTNTQVIDDSTTNNLNKDCDIDTEVPLNSETQTETNVTDELNSNPETKNSTLELNLSNTETNVQTVSGILSNSETTEIVAETSQHKPENFNSETNKTPIENMTEQSSDNNDINKEHSDERKRQSDLSEGEVTDESDVEAHDVIPEVVCISDEESPKIKKKSKKEKKSKKNKDFCEDSDQNFYKEPAKQSERLIEELQAIESKLNGTDSPVIEIDEDIYEVLELSDDSSCYEVEGTYLSKEPTDEEIQALSARIDEIKREDVVTDEQIEEHERALAETEATDSNIENISWKDRYLDSKKVQKVLTTSNILNALRKKNLELKKKMIEAKKAEIDSQIESEKEVEQPLPVEEGSIDHFNTLQGSTTYVDPVKDPESDVSKDMKKDAKKILKMFKKLLKMSQEGKDKDPNRVKKKKNKKKKKEDKDKTENTQENN